MLIYQVPVTGLKTPFRDGLLRHVAEDVLKLAKVILTTLYCSATFIQYPGECFLVSFQRRKDGEREREYFLTMDFYLFAQDGLERRGYKESGFLREVAEVVKTGMDHSNSFFSLKSNSSV
jgi:glutamate--cysteine ligase